MATIKITRWSPDTCGCVFEICADVDDPQDQGQFLLVNSVCEKHSALASKQKKPDHATKAKYPLKLIDDAKQRNTKQHSDAIDKVKDKPKQKKDLEDLTPKIDKHNADITDEWNGLVDQPYAFDSNIFDTVLKENTDKNKNQPT